MGFINNITGGGASGGAASNSVSSKIVDELKVDVAVVETKVNSLPFDITGVKVDKNFDLNNFVVTNVPTPTASNQIANKGYVETWIKKDGVGNINAEGKKIINVVGPSSSDSGGAVANKGYVDTSITTSQTFVINDVASKYLDKNTGGTMSGGINMDNQNIFGLQNPPKFGTSATSKDYVHNHVKSFLAANIVEQNGLVKDSNDKIKIDSSIARSTIAPVLPRGGVERDSSGKIKLVDAVVKSLIQMDGNYHSWSNEFIKNCAAGHWLIFDNTSAKVGTYGVLSGTNVESLHYQGFGERKNIVKFSDAERPTSGTGLINGKCNYLTFDGTNDRMRCDMDLNITSGDKTLSITVVYRLTSYGNSTSVGLRNAIIGNDNPGWDKFICMNDSKHFIVSNAKKESASFNGGDNITITTFPTKANPTELNKWIVITVTWSPQLGADGSQVWCNGQKLRNFTAKENVGATHFSIGSVNANRVEAPLAGDIAELIVFKREDELNNASTIKRIQKHLLEKYGITHEPMLSM